MARLAALNEGLVQVGRLVAGIVHEIRGPISVIRGSAEILRMEHPDDAGVLGRVDPIIAACQLLHARLEHLMTAVRSGPMSPQPLEVPPLLREVAELFRKGTSPRQQAVEIRCEAAEGTPLVQGDPGRLMQVLLNLVANAHDAILAHKARGEVTLRAEAHAGPEGVSIHVEDDGPGFPAGVVERAFEPFFTTKPNGSGFGLYLAAEIIRDHGGRIEARTREGGGACVSIWLPRGELPEGGA
jgi:signal transduction histidine kinase